MRQILRFLGSGPTDGGKFGLWNLVPSGAGGSLNWLSKVYGSTKVSDFYFSNLMRKKVLTFGTREVILPVLILVWGRSSIG